LEPSEGEQDERYDERTDRVLASDVSGARLETREKRGEATHWNEPVHDGDGKEQDAKKSGDQRQGSVHRADVREDRRFSVTARLCGWNFQRRGSESVNLLSIMRR
jgi:adenine-specific DNA methylase